MSAAPSSAGPVGGGGLLRYAGAALPLFILVFLALLVVPISGAFLDVCLVLNLGLALLIVFLAGYVERPLDFSVFPTVLLLMTIGRLSLNVASTRMILREGKDFGGLIITTFGRWVVGGDYLVGCVIFLILAVIQIVVITKGAERVAEVASRFTLDSLPMKQMSVESAVSSGALTDAEAVAARRDLQREMDFYGAMDGASKFIKGETVTSIFIVVVNIVGGVAIGLSKGGASNIADLVRTYALLTVGDGLVGFLPSVLVALAAGVIITRSSVAGQLSRDLATQLASDPTPLAMALGVLSLLMFTFGVFAGVAPVPFLGAGAFLAYAAWYVLEHGAGLLGTPPARASELAAAAKAAAEAADSRAVGSLPAVELVISAPLWDAWEADGSLERLRSLTETTRLAAYRERGLPLGPLALQRAEPGAVDDDYAVRLRGEAVSSGRLAAGKLLALPRPGDRLTVAGTSVSSPTGRGMARWIEPALGAEAAASGCRVLDGPGVVEAVLQSAVLTHAAELLGLQAVDEIWRGVATNFPAVAAAMEDRKVDRVVLTRVLQGLLEEGISVRNAPGICEAVVAAGSPPGGAEAVLELVRVALGRQISRTFADGERVLHCLELAPRLEDELSQALVPGAAGTLPALTLAPGRSMELMEALMAAASRVRSPASAPVLLTSARLRRELWRFARRDIRDLVVLAYDEVHSTFSPRVRATVELASAAAPALRPVPAGAALDDVRDDEELDAV